MQAPDAREPIPLRYLRVRASVIPLAPHDKRPYLDVLDGRTWAPYQQRRASDDEVLGWLAQGHDHNWGVVCGQVSDGLYCGDVDDPDFAAWVLDHARDPLLRGACVVRSGSGKAHIWFRSPNKLLSGRWKPSRGRAVGDIRGDGNGNAGPSYMVVPPSVHPDTGEPYRYIAHNLGDLPSIDNGEAFLADILGAYLNQSLGGLVEEPSNSQHILELDDADKGRVLAKVRELKLKKKFSDTLLVPGNQAPGTRHWADMAPGSRSEIDFAVCCELQRRGLVFKEIEEIFSVALIRGNCYGDKDRDHHGYSYLKLTYDRARAAILKADQALRQAVGQNFKTLDVVREHFDESTSKYWLTVECQRADGRVTTDRVGLADKDLMRLEKVKEAFVTQIKFAPIFNANQRGNSFTETFGQAVIDMVSEVHQAPEAYTRFGPTAMRLRSLMRRLPTEAPADQGMADRLGWQQDGAYWLISQEITRILRADDHVLKNEDAQQVMNLLGECHRTYHRWPDGERVEIIVVKLHPA